MTTRQATTEVRASNQITHRWGHIFVQVSKEDEALHQYLATGTELDRAVLLASIGSAEPDLDWLSARGGDGEAFQVALLRHDYLRYENSLRAIHDAGGRHDQAEIDANLPPAATEFAALRRQSVANVERKQRDLAAYLVSVDGRNRRLQSLAAGVFACDLALVVLCIVILLGYQRRVERHAASSHHKAMHDGLTGLANRSLFHDRTDYALRLATRTREPVGIIGLDLNGFKQINDTLGHHSGDLLLKHVADRLVACVRDTDTIARLGGDEFAILMPNVTSVDHAAEVAGRVLNAIRAPIDLDGQTVGVGASVGLAVFPAHGDRTDQLLQKADAAMYRAKRGKLGVCIFGPEDLPDAAQTMTGSVLERVSPSPPRPA